MWASQEQGITSTSHETRGYALAADATGAGRRRGVATHGYTGCRASVGRDGPPRGWIGERVWWLARYPNGASAVHVASLPSGDEIWCAACQQFHGRQGIVLVLMSTTLLLHCRATGGVLAEC